MRMIPCMLCDIHKSNQIESNSQQNPYTCISMNRCVISTKVIKLKAIHNKEMEYSFRVQLCDIHKSNQIESNSQPSTKPTTSYYSCVISTKVIKLKIFVLYLGRRERLNYLNFVAIF